MTGRIPITKKITLEVQCGELEILDEGESWAVVYHNSRFVGSPFRCPVTFSKEFRRHNLRQDPVVVTFLSDFLRD